MLVPTRVLRGEVRDHRLGAPGESSTSRRWSYRHGPAAGYEGERLSVLVLGRHHRRDGLGFALIDARDPPPAARVEALPDRFILAMVQRRPHRPGRAGSRGTG